MYCENAKRCVKFEVFTAVIMKNAVFWDAAPCISCVTRRFGGTYRLHLQGKKINERGTSVSRWLHGHLSANADCRSLFLFADVFQRFVCANITLEAVALSTPNNVAVFITDAPVKRAPTFCPLSKSDKCTIFPFFHTNCH
jgi:hypothetical protein